MVFCGLSQKKHRQSHLKKRNNFPPGMDAMEVFVVVGDG